MRHQGENAGAASPAAPVAKAINPCPFVSHFTALAIIKFRQFTLRQKQSVKLVEKIR